MDSKKQEVRTYQMLGLKSKPRNERQKQFLQTVRSRMILGEGTPESPQLIVTIQEYQKMRLTVMEELLRSKTFPDGMDRETILETLQPQIHQAVYQRLAREKKQGHRLESTFHRLHGRHPTTQERALLEIIPQVATPHTLTDWRNDLLQDVLSQIDHSRLTNQSKLQTVWAEVLGVELAQQSELCKVEQGTGWFRCLNSTLSYQIQKRRPDLPLLLTKKLGMKVTQLRVLY